MLSIGEGEGGAASHADVAVGPFRRSIAVDHAAGDCDLGREAEAFSLQAVVHRADIRQLVSSLCRSGPALNEVEDLLLDVLVHCSHAICLEQRDQVVHKLAGCDLGEEVGAAILDAGVCQLEGRDLDIGILVAYSLLQRSHGIFRLHRFTPDQVRDF